MSISFIVTTYNVAPYVRKCLESLAECVKTGDQVILVDDGSTDDVANKVEHFIRNGGFREGVLWTPVWLGVNTFGGVGIAANIALNHVACETVFFVDGDDYLIPTAFYKARRDYEGDPSDILLTNYHEFDEIERSLKKPADSYKWKALEESACGEQRRMAALNMIAVPWRKFYRNSFLRSNHIRFPEGDFFFEDNPFHWDVCLAAKTIRFSNQVVCHHRINRAGQTMASDGVELAAIFSHFKEIWAKIPLFKGNYRIQSIRWLIENMTWHLERLQPSAFNAYVRSASDALRCIDSKTWLSSKLEDLRDTNAWRYAHEIRQGRMWEVVEAMQRESLCKALSCIGNHIDKIEGRLSNLECRSEQHIDMLSAHRAIAEFRSFQNLGLCRSFFE
jgi:glycosyltransferase involved in cell wall biosynthesis